MDKIKELSSAVVNGEESKAQSIVKILLDEGVYPLEIINNGLIAGMNLVGAKFKEGKMYVPEVLMAAKTMSSAMDIVDPYLADVEVKSLGKVVIGTVKGDLHDIGKNLVEMMINSAGFTVINLGIDLEPEAFIRAFEEHNPDIVGMSALLTTTMSAMKDTIDLFVEKGLRDKVNIIVGGAPVNQNFADAIGADGYAPDAASATDLCKQLIE